MSEHSAAPLQVVVIRDGGDVDLSSYEDAVAGALVGGRDGYGRLAAGDRLGVEFRVFSAVPAMNPAAILDATLHTATIVLIDDCFLRSGNEELWRWVASTWEHTRSSGQRHSFIAMAMSERAGDRFRSLAPALHSVFVLHAHELGERALRADIFAVRAMHECRLLLVGGRGGNLQIFISHAKIDGLPLAQSLRYLIESLRWLGRFYDVYDLGPGDACRQIERAVESSVMVMLRTDVYDDRPHCREEVYLADKYAVPAVLVDARTALNYPAGTLPLDRIPVVRIPDGNLLRILSLAVREGLRFAIFARRVESLRSVYFPAAQVRVFGTAPSMPGLLHACRDLAPYSAQPRVIIYPDPPLRDGVLEAASALVERYGPGTRLVTPQTLAVEGDRR